MKNFLITILLFIVFLSAVSAQDEVFAIGKADLESPFNEVHCPNSTGLVNWLMRQNLTLFAYQSILKFESGVGKNSNDDPQNLLFVNYLPVVNKENFGINMGVKYGRYGLMTPNNLIDKKYQHLWLWAGSTYKISNNVSIVFSGEIYKRGNSGTFNKKTGNQLFYMIGTAIKVSSKIMILPMAGYNHTWKEGSLKEGMIGGVQIKWTSSKDFQLLTGLPVIFGCEWKVSEKVNIGLYGYYNKRSDGFIRYRIGENLSVSLLFKNELQGFEDTYLNKSDFDTGYGIVNYDNLTQQQQTAALELGIRILSNISLNISAGYKFGSDTEFNFNEKKVWAIEGSDNFFVGLNFSFLQFQ